MMNKLLVMMIAAAAGCGVVTKPGPATGGSGDDGGDDAGIDPGSDAGSDSGSGSGTGSGSLLPPNVLIGSIEDERNDVVTFSGGKAHHTHAGAVTDLGTGCPSIYKYAYLMDAPLSAVVDEAAPNPIAWKVRSDSPNLDTSATAYRIRDAANTVVLDWTHLTADGDGIYHVVLTRNAIAQLGTKSGQFHVEVKLHDLDGQDTIPTACFDNHPLAAPLDIAPLATADLFSYSFSAHSPIASMLNYSGPAVYSLAITQYAAEPVTITLHVPQTMYTATRLTADAYVRTLDDTTHLTCPDIWHGACAQQAIPMPVYANVLTPNVATISGQLLAGVTDDVTHQVVCNSGSGSPDVVACTLPARAANQPPRSYTAWISLNEVPQLAPPFLSGLLGGFVDQLVGAQFFTSAQPSPEAIVTCLQPNSVGMFGTPGYHMECFETGHYEHVSALKEAKLDFPAYAIQLTSATTPTATFVTPPNIPAAYFQIAAKSWDSGDSGL